MQLDLRAVLDEAGRVQHLLEIPKPPYYIQISKRKGNNNELTVKTNNYQLICPRSQTPIFAVLKNRAKHGIKHCNCSADLVGSFYL